MRRFGFSVVLVGCATAFACGNSGGSSANGSNSLGDGGGEASTETLDASMEAEVGAGAADAAVDTERGTEGSADASADGGPPCGWAPYNDGLSGATISDVLFDLPRASTPTVYATSGSTLFASSNNGQTWLTRGTFSGGTIEYLSAPAGDQKLLLATSSAGVIESKDSGQTWSVLSFGNVATSAIAVAASQSLRVYVGVTGAGVFRSDDGGASWSAVNQGYPQAITMTLDVAPDNPDEVVAGVALLNAQGGASTSGALVRTTDGGESWQTVAQNDGDIWGVRRCPADPTVLYAATSDGLAQSTDRGVTWALSPVTGVVEDVAINPSACNDVYAMMQGAGPRHSTDGGQTFGASLSQGLNLVPLGTWPGRIVANPTIPGGLLVGSHGGMWFTTNGGTLWSAADGLLGLHVTSLATSPLDPSHVWLASWGSGVWHRPSSSVPWQRVSAQALPVDYTFMATPDPGTMSRVFVGSQSTLYQSADGMTFTADSLQQNEFSVAIDPSDSNVIYSATQIGGVYKSVNGGAQWAASNGALAPWATPAGTFIDVRSVAVDPDSVQTVYIGTAVSRGLYRESRRWRLVGERPRAGRSDGNCLLLVSGPPATLYACVAGSGIAASSDGGASWTDVSQGLPTLDVADVALDAATGNLYATSASGVYVRHAEQSWSGIDVACLDNAAAITIVSNGSSRSLLVGSAGSVFAHPL